MDFSLTARETEWRDRVIAFMNKHVYPAIPVYDSQMEAFGSNRWQVVPVLEELKAKAKAEGLWNLFLAPNPEHDTDEYQGAGLTNLEYAMCSEQMGKVPWGSEVFNCSAPDTGNMEVLHRYGTKKQKDTWLRPLMAGEIRSVFFMTEPAVASSDATNIETSIKRDGDHYVINGRKWWSSGAGDPRCKIGILMGKTDTSKPRHEQQSQILVPLDTPGVKIVRMLPVFGFDDAPHGHAEVVFDNVRVPAENLVGGENNGWQVASTHLELEHGGGGAIGRNRWFGRALQWSREHQRDGRPLIEDPEARESLANVFILTEISRLFGMRNFWMNRSHTPMTYEGSQSSYYRKLAGLDISEELHSLFGPYALTHDERWDFSGGTLDVPSEQRRRAGDSPRCGARCR